METLHFGAVMGLCATSLVIYSNTCHPSLKTCLVFQQKQPTAIQASRSPQSQSGQRSIEILLEHIDPKSKRVLPVYPETIFELLEAAHKYQISTITEWFLEQAGLQQVDGSQEQPVFLPAFTSAHPRLALKCALHFDFPRIGKLALRELAGAPSSEVELKNTDLASRVYMYQLQLRQDRVDRYRKWFSELVDTYKHGWMTSGCLSCLRLLCGWFIGMERAVFASPRWQSFQEAYRQGNKCRGCGGTAWYNHITHSLQLWETQALQLEAALPDWPF